MSENAGRAKRLERTGSADDMTTTPSDTQASKDMSVQRRSTINKQPARVARAFILWPLVIYSLIQINSYLLANNNHSNCLSALQQTGSPPLSKPSQARSSANLCCHASSCSSSEAIESTLETNDASLLHSLSKAYLSLLNLLNHQDGFFFDDRSLFGGKFLLAEAYSIQYQAHQEKGIITLNSTNFNSELIQYKHPFPHIKLIDYCLSYSLFSKKFEKTYAELAREIHPWRNVIRPSAIDLSVPGNSPIAHSWDVDTVPTLRIHPPPDPLRAKILNDQLELWTKTLMPSDLQRSTFQQYNESGLMVKRLGVMQYMNNVQLLKSDLLSYIQSYVLENSSELPISWPNLKSVTEESLLELRLNHPRQELFLIIDGSISTSAKDQSSSAVPSLAFNIMLELSSSSAWKAIRYVRASENRALIEDVIEQQKKASEQRANQFTSQVDLLNTLLSSQPTDSNNVLLVYLDDSHTPVRASNHSVPFPFMTIKTVADLVTMEKASPGSPENYNSRARRFADQDSSLYKTLSNQRMVELVANFVKHTYTETSIDREFTEALSRFEESGKLDDSSKYLSQLAEESTKVQQQPHLRKSNLENQVFNQALTNDSSLLGKIRNFFNRPSSQHKWTLSSASDIYDYDDKLKAIRYMLFTEIPRSSTIDKSLVDQQGKLNTLVNMVTVIKAYFPFADASSIQFIDGVLSYLMKQQSRLSSVKTEDLQSSGFDTRQFKQELKRLESENKRLPEIKGWKHCTGYPCALWRLFHTLTAFEYKKLNQIRQPTSRSLATGLRQVDNNLSPSVEAITMKSTDSLSPPSPVERLVSPPSTTTILSLTIATPNTSQTSDEIRANKPLTEADLPPPVLLVMRDYITTFFSCSECATKFRSEAEDLSLERIRQQEPAEFSILWLWETHNRVNKRLSVDLETNPPERPKVWFPTYDQCFSCYKKAPSFLKDTTVDSVTIFHESIEWNMQEILHFLVQEYTKQPMDSQINLFGNQVLYGFKYIVVTCVCFLILIVVLRCTTYYVEMQRRRKTTMLNGNGTRYSLELQ